MFLTDYHALILDCDGVLVDCDQGIWTALQPAFSNADISPDRTTLLQRFYAELKKLSSHNDDSGFFAQLCMAHHKLARAFSIKVTWQDSLAFSLTAQQWRLYADTLGALQYLRKYYRLAVLSTRDPDNRVAFAQSLGLVSDEMIRPEELLMWMKQYEIPPARALRIVSDRNTTVEKHNTCLLRRMSSNRILDCSGEICANSLADLVWQHQRSLRSL